LTPEKVATKLCVSDGPTPETEMKNLIQRFLAYIDMRAAQAASYDDFLFHRSRFGGVPV
jgi:hypothetical protein